MTFEYIETNATSSYPRECFPFVVVERSLPSFSFLSTSSSSSHSFFPTPSSTSTTPLKKNRLRNRELSSVELRSLDYDYDEGAAAAAGVAGGAGGGGEAGGTGSVIAGGINTNLASARKIVEGLIGGSSAASNAAAAIAAAAAVAKADNDAATAAAAAAAAPASTAEGGAAAGAPAKTLEARRSSIDNSTSTSTNPVTKNSAAAAALDETVEALYVRAERSRLHSSPGGTVLEEVLDISQLLRDAGSAIVDDSFLRCFTSAPDEPWNWNLYLAPLWALGVVFRHAVLFPLRMILLLTGVLLFLIAFFGAKPFFMLLGTRKTSEMRAKWEKDCVQFLSQTFVASWTAVVRYHGPRPVARPGRVWVANHTSMIDFIILTACSPFAVIMQLHGGWVGFLQTQVLNALGCLWFNRTEVKDRALVAERMRAHVWREGAAPLLIFPEGTCVNTRYCVMFKRGAFDLGGATVCPVAIRYDRVFVDAFWNSKRQSFTAHLMRLMRSWAVVCDVWFLEPQAARPGETPQLFAERVQRMIAQRAGLTIAPWDGYLKYYNLGAKHPDLIEKRRKLMGDKMGELLAQEAKSKGGVGSGGGSTGAAAATTTTAAGAATATTATRTANGNGDGSPSTSKGTGSLFRRRPSDKM